MIYEVIILGQVTSRHRTVVGAVRSARAQWDGTTIGDGAPTIYADEVTVEYDSTWAERVIGMAPGPERDRAAATLVRP